MTFYCSRWCNKTLYIQPKRTAPSRAIHGDAIILFFFLSHSSYHSLQPKQTHDTHVNNIVQCAARRDHLRTEYSVHIAHPLTLTFFIWQLPNVTGNIVHVCALRSILIFGREKMTKMNRIMKLMATSRRCRVLLFVSQTDTEHWCDQLIYANHVYDTDASINIIIFNPFISMEYSTTNKWRIWAHVVHRSLLARQRHRHRRLQYWMHFIIGIWHTQWSVIGIGVASSNCDFINHNPQPLFKFVRHFIE